VKLDQLDCSFKSSLFHASLNAGDMADEKTFSSPLPSSP